jgi:hypothetical protein
MLYSRRHYTDTIECLKEHKMSECEDTELQNKAWRDTSTDRSRHTVSVTVILMKEG